MGNEDESKRSDGASESTEPKQGKHARVFDFEEMMKANLKTAENRRALAEEKELANKQESAVREDPKDKSASAAPEASDDDDDFMPPLPPGFTPDKEFIVDEQSAGTSGEKDPDRDSDYEEFEDKDEVPVEKLIPTSCEAKLRHGSKPVSCLRVEPNGVRFASGGLDYVVNLYDFQKMDMSLRADKDLTPCESHVINSLAFTHNGESLLVCSGQAQIRLLDRKGTQWAETIRGDQYLVDLSHTKGHTAAVNCCMFNPLVKTEFMSCSDDGTLRIWSLDDFKELTKCINTHRKVIKTKNANGKRTIPLTCCYSHDGKLVAAGCDDGSIQVWKNAKFFTSHHYLVRAAHKGPLTCIAFSPDSQRILSRAFDDTLKIWSLKDNKKPLAEKTGLENAFKSTDCGFSPRGELVYTGTSSPNDQTPGQMLFFNPDNLDLVYKIDFPGLSVTRIDWHPRINQILVGLSDGSIRIYYDLVDSTRGVMQCITKPVKRTRASEFVREEMILSPLTLEMFQPRGEEGEEKEVTGWRLRKFLRMKDNETRPQFRRPAEMPSDASVGGRVRASGSTLHSYLAQQIGTQRNKEFMQDSDIRSSILKHADEAAKNPLYIDKAYRKNQPKPIFQEKTTAPEEEEDDKELQPLFKMPRLG